MNSPSYFDITNILELEIDKRRYILAAKLEDKLHHDDKYCELDKPWHADKEPTYPIPEALGHKVRDEEHRHKDAPRHAHTDKDGEVVEVEVGRYILEHNPQIADVVYTEERHGDNGKGKGNSPRHRAHNGIVGYAVEEWAHRLMNNERHAMSTTPRNKLPRGTMPQATYKHREEVVEIHSELTMTVAAQRNIEVVAQPLRERYVPAVPKLGDILRLIGKVEVLGQRKAHYKGDTDSHV